MYCYLIEDFTVSVMILLRFLVFLPLHRTTQMYCYLIEDFTVSDDTPTFSCLYTEPQMY